MTARRSFLDLISSGWPIRLRLSVRRTVRPAKTTPAWAASAGRIRARYPCLSAAASRKAPLSLKLCCYVVAPLVGAVLAAGVGYAISDERGKGGLVGAITAILFVPILLTPLVAWMWGIDYRQYR